jgi:hypothetical protein
VLESVELEGENSKRRVVMSSRKSLAAILVLLGLFTLNLACGSQTLIRQNAFDTMSIAILEIAKDSSNVQTVDGVTITVEPVSPGSDEMIEILRSRVSKPACLSGQNVTITERMVPALGGNPMPIFKVRVQNNTDHVIEMSKVVIAYIPEGKNPIAPSGGMGQDVAASQGGFTGGNQAAMAAYKASMSRGQSPASVAAQAAEITKAPILGPQVKILPKYPYEGVVFFNFNLLSAGNTGEFQIYDVVTIVDEAGTPKKRANFSFKYKITKGMASTLGALGPRASSFSSTPFQ